MRLTASQPPTADQKDALFSSLKNELGAIRNLVITVVNTTATEDRRRLGSALRGSLRDSATEKTRRLTGAYRWDVTFEIVSTVEEASALAGSMSNLTTRQSFHQSLQDNGVGATVDDSFEVLVVVATRNPSPAPVPAPSPQPSPLPSPAPTLPPTVLPSLAPIPLPSIAPTPVPSSAAPAPVPTTSPTSQPSPNPSLVPTVMAQMSPSPTRTDTATVLVALDLVADGALSAGDEETLKSTLADHLGLDLSAIRNFVIKVTVSIDREEVGMQRRHPSFFSSIESPYVLRSPSVPC